MSEFAGYYDRSQPELVDREGSTRCAVRSTNRYKIGEVASLLGITTESIRYYERMGIIYPERNPVSGYRYYSAWDINMLMRARAYRQQRFTMEEVVDAMHVFDPARVVAHLSVKEEEIREQIIEMAKVLGQVHDDQGIITDAISAQDHFKFEYRPAMHFLQSQIGYDMIESRACIVGGWIQHYAAFFLPGGIFQGPSPDDVAYGFFIEDVKLQDVNFNNETEVEALPSCLCLATSFLSGSDHALSHSSFQFALDYVEQNNLEIVGNPVSRIVYMARSGSTAYRSLHKLWIPVKGADGLVVDASDKVTDLIDDILGRTGEQQAPVPHDWFEEEAMHFDRQKSHS